MKELPIESGTEDEKGMCLTHISVNSSKALSAVPST